MDPKSPPISSERFDSRTLEEILAQRRDLPGALMPVLYEVNRRFGYIPPESVAQIASALNLSRAEVHGVVSFYRDFRSEPAGRHVIRMCRAESCQAMGANALADHVARRLGARFGETTRDGEFTLEAVYCFGNCACSPAMTIDGELHGRVTAETFDTAMARLRKQS